MNESEKRAAYYDRVKPVIGDAFAGKGLLAYGVEAFPHAVEALIRTGVLRARVEDSGPVEEGPLARAWGRAFLGQGVAEALASFSRAHNRFEDRFDILPAPPLGGEAPKGADLILAYAPGRASRVVALSDELGVPAILVSVLERSRAAQAIFVYDPARASEDDRALARILEEHPAAAPGDPYRREDFLEAGDLALGFAKALLLRGSPRERGDLEEIFEREGRRLVLRGSPSWPWEARYLTAARGREIFGRLGENALPAPKIPAALFRRQRVMIIGCGTASLFTDEIAREVGALLLLDSKPFSIFNPIRQICSTDDVEGAEKPFALQEILRRRLAPGEDWPEVEDGPIRWRGNGSLKIGAARLRLSEMLPESVALFEELCERFAPTLCVVGMGRSRDDNFTACEILRRRGIRHLVPTAFPGVTHFKQVVVDGESGPCYDCLQNHLPVDGGAGPTLDEEARSVYYGGTQPASLAETYPSAHSLYRLARALMLPEAARPAWWAPLRDEERSCLVGANQVERVGGGQGWLYGIERPGQMVAYGPADVVHARSGERCACGRIVGKVGG